MKIALNYLSWPNYEVIPFYPEGGLTLPLSTLIAHAPNDMTSHVKIPK